MDKVKHQVKSATAKDLPIQNLRFAPKDGKCPLNLQLLSIGI